MLKIDKLNAFFSSAASQNREKFRCRMTEWDCKEHFQAFINNDRHTTEKNVFKVSKKEFLYDLVNYDGCAGTLIADEIGWTVLLFGLLHNL